jgi:hypothetical protein
MPAAEMLKAAMSLRRNDFMVDPMAFWGTFDARS